MLIIAFFFSFFFCFLISSLPWSLFFLLGVGELSLEAMGLAMDRKHFASADGRGFCVVFSRHRA